MNNTEKNNQLKAFLTEYAKGNTLIADNGIIEEIEQSNQHFTLTITHEVLTSDIVQYVTFKQHENYTQGDEYNELSDVFDYENVFSVAMVDGEVIELEEKTNEKAETNMTNLLTSETNIFLKKVYFNIYDTVAIIEENETIAQELQKRSGFVYYDADNFEEEGDLLKPNLSCPLINSLLKSSMYLFGHHNDTENFEEFKKEVEKNMDIIEELEIFYSEYNNFVQNFYQQIY